MINEGKLRISFEKVATPEGEGTSGPIAA